MLNHLANEKGSKLRVAVIGASGGVGSGFVQLLEESESVESVFALSRSEPPNLGAKTKWHFLDLQKEETISNVASEIRNDGPLDIVIIASGLLHKDEVKPEKDWRNLEANSMALLFAINTIGPALVIKHFAPLMAKSNRSVLAALSARVGSISDNRLGGWYSYRASKAALNQIIKTYSIELYRKNKEAILIGLHPGTVQTSLSEPYQSNPHERFTPSQSAGYLLSVIDGATPSMSGHVYDWQGKIIPE